MITLIVVYHSNCHGIFLKHDYDEGDHLTLCKRSS
jgi:hypothetical protein